MPGLGRLGPQAPVRGKRGAVDRAPSTPPQVAARPRRPMYLRISLLLVWLMGLMAATDGLGSIDILRDPHAALAMVERTLDPKAQQLREAMVQAIIDARHVAAPLAAAGLVLGSLLAIAAGRAMFGRGRGHRLLLQAVAAYGLYLPVAYFVGQPIRQSMLATLQASPSGGLVVDGLTATELAIGVDFLATWWRIVLGGQLAALGIVFFILTRPRSRALLGGVPPADVQTESR